MRARWRAAVIAGAGALAVGALTACAGSPTPGAIATGGPKVIRVSPSPTPGGTFTVGPKVTKVSPPPTIVQTSPSWAPAIIPGPNVGMGTTPPTDPTALAKAKLWIVSATPPPGVTPLDAAPAGAPTQPATSAACDWLVQATKWWSTPSSNMSDAQAWLKTHPVTGLTADGSLSGPGSLSAVFEHGPEHGNDSLEFEFLPQGGTTTIRVDAVLVPKGAECLSSGLAPANG